MTKRWYGVLLAVAAMGLTSCSSPGSTRDAGPQSLFNGRDLSGWRALFDDPQTRLDTVWSVRDGIIVCQGEPLGCLATTGTYTNYRLEVDYRWAPGKTPGNSGIFGRINGRERALPRCLEVQLKHGNGGDLLGLQGMKLSGDPARLKFIAKHEVAGDIAAVSRQVGNERPAGEWNHVVVLVQGGKVTTWFNGQRVNEAHDAEILAGPVGLQSEGGEVHFRNVRITRLD